MVGLTGPNASGKGEVAARLRQRGFVVHSLSDIVREEATRLGLSAGRKDLIRVGNDLRREHGADVLARRILPRLGSRDVVDSIRNPAEVEALREADHFVLVGIRAPVELRFARSLGRSRPGDPTSLSEFERRELDENSADPAAQQLRATLEMADRLLDNSGALEELYRAVALLVAELGCGP